MIYQKRLPFNDSDVTPKNLKLDSSGRARRQFRFWLDAAKPEEATMGVQLEEMGKKRKFATFIKDAIRLMMALMVGDVSVLVELFPSVVEQIKAEARAEAAESSAILQFKDMIREAAKAAASETAAAIEVKQAALEPVQQMPAPDSVGLKPLGGGDGIKQLGSTKPIAGPVFDDDDVLVVQKSEGNSDAAMNFIRSMMALQKK